ncbi:MAG: VWA domain-containing protein [Parvularculaceae bacterium]|nr:VWA domain-containing protein [Parvularculaceae bacterium]
MLRSFTDFGVAQNGNIALMFAILLLPLIMAGGAGLDFARTIHARTVTQEAADAALLRAARLRGENPSLSDAELDAAARAIFDKATASIVGLAVSGFDVTYDAAAGTYSLTLDAQMPTKLVSAVGFRTADLSALSEVKLGAPPYVEVALALDNTGSMNKNGKLDSLKKSASALVETLFAAEGAEVKVGLVPFGQYVNVGTANKGASWLGAAPSGWVGCVGSRNYPLNTEDGDYATAVPAIAGNLCPSAIQPLTTDKEEILDAIDGMIGNGWTYIAEGVAWGRRILSPQAPFTEGLAMSEVKKRNGVKALVVLTDGENTRAPDYPTHDSTDTTSADALTARLCEEAKKDGLTVYAIAFDVTDPGVRKLLEDCGTSTGHYFEPSNAAELAAVFAKIATGLRNLSLSK